MTEAEAQLLAETLFAHYPAARPSKLNLDAYTNALKDMSLDVAQAAIVRTTRTSKFCPSVAELCAACVVNARGHRRTGEEAYTELMAAVRRFGRCYGDSKPPEFQDPLMARCIGVWGTWNGLCNSPEDDAAGRARFIQLYNSLAEKDDQHAVLPAALRTERQFGFAAARAVRSIPDALPPRRKPSEIDSAARALLAEIEAERVT